MEIVNAYLSGRDIILLRRDSGGALRREAAAPEYIVYLRMEDLGEDLSRQISRSQFVRSFKREGAWLRVGFVDSLIREDIIRGKRGGPPSPFTERGIATYEGDVHPVRRLLTDRGATIQKPRRCYFDLETDSRVPFSKKEEMRILSWAVEGEDGRRKSYVLREDSHQAEEELLGLFWEAVADYDQLLAWNGDNFDFPVLRTRTDRTSIKVDANRWLYLDHLALFKRMNMHSAESGDEKQSMKLNSIAMAILGEGKNDFDASKTYEKWAADGKDREELLAYNEQDTALLPKIEGKTGFAALFDTLADACRILPDSKGLQPTHQMDGYMLRLGLERGVHFPTKKFRDGEGDQFKGAYVMEPKARGIERDVHVCDFSAMYPSIMLTWNMSPDTRVDIPINGPIQEGTCRSPSTRQGFRTDTEGILIVALKEILALRKRSNDLKASLPPGISEWHEADRQSTAYKVVVNSFYGVIGSPFSRYFDKRIAESVTQNGVWLIKLVIEHAERLGMRVIYTDTDSCFVKDATRTQFEEFVRWCNTDLFPGAVAEQGCVENHIKLAYEKQFSRIVFSGAKRYAAAYAHYKGKAAEKDSKPEVKGLEFKRGDTALLARRLQEQIIHHTIVGGDERVDTYKGILDAALRRVLNDPLPIGEVELAKAVTKPLKEYAAKKKIDGEDSSLPVHVRVAKLLAERGREVGEGTRIGYVVTDGDGGINCAIPSEDYTGELDRYYLWESLVYPPSLRFLQAAFPDVDWSAGYEKVRPPKPRGRKRVQEGQGQYGPLFQISAPEGGVSTPPADAFAAAGSAVESVLVLDEEQVSTRMLEDFAAVVKKYPGRCPLVIRVQLKGGASAILDASHRLDASPELLAELDALFWDVAAIREWEIQCAS